MPKYLSAELHVMVACPRISKALKQRKRGIFVPFHLKTFQFSKNGCRDATKVHKALQISVIV